MSHLLLHFSSHHHTQREQDIVIAELRTMAQIYLETDHQIMRRTDMTAEESHAYDVVLDNLARNMKRIIGNALQAHSNSAIKDMDGYTLCQLIYLLTGNNAEFE